MNVNVVISLYKQRRRHAEISVLAQPGPGPGECGGRGDRPRVGASLPPRGERRRERYPAFSLVELIHYCALIGLEL